MVALLIALPILFVTVAIVHTILACSCPG